MVFVRNRSFENRLGNVAKSYGNAAREVGVGTLQANQDYRQFAEEQYWSVCAASFIIGTMMHELLYAIAQFLKSSGNNIGGVIAGIIQMFLNAPWRLRLLFGLIDFTQEQGVVEPPQLTNNTNRRTNRRPVNRTVRRTVRRAVRRAVRNEHNRTIKKRAKEKKKKKTTVRRPTAPRRKKKGKKGKKDKEDKEDKEDNKNENKN